MSVQYCIFIFKAGILDSEVAGIVASMCLKPFAQHVDLG